MISRQFDDAMKALHKAEDALQHAEYNFKLRIFIVTANRSYYSAFYCLTALLYSQNIYAKTHQGTHSKFFELFIKTKIFPVHVADYVSFLFKYRQQADYDFDTDLSEEEAKTLLSKATEFLNLTKDYFNQLTADSDTDNS